MLSVQRLIHAAQMRDVLAATSDPSARLPLDADDHRSLQATVEALTRPGPQSPELEDIQLHVLPRLPGWPTGLSIVRAVQNEVGVPADLKRFGAQAPPFAHEHPLLLARLADGTWSYARNPAPPHDWRTLRDATRPLLSTCAVALIDRLKDDGWQTLARIAGDSRLRPDSGSMPLLLAKLSLRITDWLHQASQCRWVVAPTDVAPGLVNAGQAQQSASASALKLHNRSTPSMAPVGIAAPRPCLPPPPGAAGMQPKRPNVDRRVDQSLRPPRSYRLPGNDPSLPGATNAPRPAIVGMTPPPEKRARLDAPSASASASGTSASRPALAAATSSVDMWAEIHALMSHESISRMLLTPDSPPNVGLIDPDGLDHFVDLT